MGFLSEQPLDVHAIEALVADPASGAILTFSGVARNSPAQGAGPAVVGLSYEAYTPMALAEMEKIEAELKERWPAARVAIGHRLGALSIGDVAVVIAVSAPHRAAAYEASRYAIEAFKTRVPIWKKEHYADGSAWVANRP